jgi:hypothetical protein
VRTATATYSKVRGVEKSVCIGRVVKAAPPIAQSQGPVRLLDAADPKGSLCSRPQATHVREAVNAAQLRSRRHASMDFRLHFLFAMR